MPEQAPKKVIDPCTIEGASELEVHVQSRLGGQLREFKIVVGEEGLVLRGQAHTYYAKQLAQHVVMQATDFPIQANEIDVG